MLAKAKNEIVDIRGLREESGYVSIYLSSGECITIKEAYTSANEGVAFLFDFCDLRWEEDKPLLFHALREAGSPPEDLFTEEVESIVDWDVWEYFELITSKGSIWLRFWGNIDPSYRGLVDVSVDKVH
jgi:hypothetical protein